MRVVLNKNKNTSFLALVVTMATFTIMLERVPISDSRPKQHKTTARKSSSLFDASPPCTAEQNQRQVSTWCQHNAARHNLLLIFPLLRLHLPDVTLLVDVGANKGLVSARWLELWRPELNIRARDYALHYVAPFFAKRNVTKEAGHACGVTSMCTDPDAQEAEFLRNFAPVRRPLVPLEIHSFEPSPHLYNMHNELQASKLPLRPVSQPAATRRDNHTTTTTTTSTTWHWHQIAASDYDGDVYFSSLWNEGSKIDPNSKSEPNTRSARLDTLVYGQDGLFGDRIIDVLKIDAETVDLKVVAGSTRLLLDQRIRVVMWETPNHFPLETFPNDFGGPVKSFGQVMHRMDVYAGMSCYFPAKEHRTIKVTGAGCWEALDASPRCGTACPWGPTCPVDFGNVVCVSRTLAPALYRAMEAQALIY